MFLKIPFVALFAILLLEICEGKEYKMNSKKIYEADLVPVSSTVIPLPIYKVSSNLNFPKDNKGKLMKPVGPISLITSAKKKKPTSLAEKLIGYDQISTVKRDYH